MIAPTGGFELSTAAPGGAGSVLLLSGPAGGTMEDVGPGVLAIGTGMDEGTGVAAAGRLPLPLIVSKKTILDDRDLT